MVYSNLAIENVWGKEEEELSKMIRKTQDFNTLLPLVQAVNWVNAFHFWRETDFSLLFHAAISNNKVALNLLLEAGADPTLQNISGTNVFMLFAKRGRDRGHDEMAKMCLEKVPKEKREDFVNYTTTSGRPAHMKSAELNQLGSTNLNLKSCPNKLAMIVPSTQNDDEPLPNADFDDRVKEVTSKMTDLFQGCIATDGERCILKNGVKMHQKIKICCSYTTPETYQDMKMKLEKLAQTCAVEWKQEWVAMIHDGGYFEVPL